MDILEGLNDKQCEAVLQTEGPVLILAGAGSGKTKALTHRIAYLIREKEVSPYNILAVTFTNKAAEEMRTRISSLMAYGKSHIDKQYVIGDKQNMPWAGTFHSVCVKILRREIYQMGYKQSFTIYDEGESLIMIKRVMKELNYDPKQYNPHAVKNFISGAKNELLTPIEYENFVEGHFQEVVAEVYKKYQSELKEANALDFDDLLMKTVQLFQQLPEVLANYQNIFKYILVDEYQDTNTAQYKMVKMLAEKHRNICVVGDDYQAIYAFRGANFKNILNFEKDYPDAKIIKMEQNYRSTQNILSAADVIIKQNINRTDKTLWTENEEGAPISIYEASDEHDEVEFVIREIQSMLKSKCLSDFVILYRTNAQSRVVEEVLLDYGIPYRLIGAYRFYERKEVKDILSYLKLINNPVDKVSFERVINVPPKGIGAKTIEQFNKGIVNPKIAKFLDTMDGLRKSAEEMTASEMIDLVADRTGYKTWTLDGTDEGEARWENIEELKSVAQNTNSLEEFLEKVSLIADIDNLDQSQEAVTMMTLHNAKGLEFPTVFIVGMEEGLFPHSRAILDPSEMEEERRLCYVGMTRAKKRLYLLHAGSRMIYGQMNANMRSRFIDSLPEHLVDKI